MKELLHKQLFVEGLGTGILTFAVFTSMNSPNFPISTPFIASITLGFMVLTIGKISGAHINPAVTVGLFAAKKIEVRTAIKYIIAQFLGAFVARQIGLMLFPHAVVLVGIDALSVGIHEALGASMLCFAVISVVQKTVVEHLAALTIGLGLLLGIFFAAPGSVGVLNPAVSLGIGVLNISYLFGPCLASIVVMKLYREFFSS